MIRAVSFVGSGNVATQFAKAFREKDVLIQQIFSRDINHAKELSSQVNASAISDFSELNLSVDLIIIAVNDDAIDEVAKQIKTSSVVIHMSGASSLSKLENCGENTG
ncbi:MAG: NAD(P)-binding domain-containing protein, partial [Flavobacteriales bacterium]|nr:NAD(P)-binding domain-containing protein [Flavobacteriales bacterium]